MQTVEQLYGCLHTMHQVLVLVIMEPSHQWPDEAFNSAEARS